MADAARARDLLVEALRGAPPCPRGVTGVVDDHPGAQPARPGGGGPRARAGAAAPSSRAAAVVSRLPTAQPLAPPLRRWHLGRTGQGLQDPCAREEGEGARAASARLPQAAVPGAPQRGVRLHRGARDAGARHDGSGRGPVQRLLLSFSFSLRKQLLLAAPGVTQASRFVYSFVVKFPRFFPFNFPPGIS